jgi:PAS domain S-box-containing protein
MSKHTHEWLCQQIVDNARDAIIFADRDGVIRLWNSGAEAIFGYSAHEALEKTLDLIIPERFRERHWEGYRRVMSTGTTQYDQQLLAVPGLSKDGTRTSIEFTVTILNDETGAPLGIAAIVRDVTERWQRDRATQEHVSQLEARLAEKAQTEASVGPSAGGTG